MQPGRAYPRREVVARKEEGAAVVFCSPNFSFPVLCKHGEKAVGKATLLFAPQAARRLTPALKVTHKLSVYMSL